MAVVVPSYTLLKLGLAESPTIAALNCAGVIVPIDAVTGVPASPYPYTGMPPAVVITRPAAVVGDVTGILLPASAV